MQAKSLRFVPKRNLTRARTFTVRTDPLARRDEAGCKAGRAVRTHQAGEIYTTPEWAGFGRQ